jgi:hypothetical protein
MTDTLYNPLIVELARLPDRLATLIDGRVEADLRRRQEDGEWSAKEIACHLRDGARIYHERLFLAATHERPLLPGYDEAALARDKNYQEAETAAIIPELRSWREETVDLLAGLRPEAWDHVAIHEEIGPMTVAQLAVHMAEHEVDHLRGIARLLDAPVAFGGGA